MTVQHSPCAGRQGRFTLARVSHHASTAAAHLRTLTRDLEVRLLAVPAGTPPGPNPEISRQSTNLHALATRRGEKSGLSSRGSSPDLEPIVKKAKPLPHRNRSKTGRYRAKLKAKHRRVRLRRSKGERGTYR